jgi:hypothetical protein
MRIAVLVALPTLDHGRTVTRDGFGTNSFATDAVES